MPNLLKLLFLSFPLLLAQAAHAQGTAQQTIVTEQEFDPASIEQDIAAALDELNVVAGLSVAVYSPGNRFARGFGVADTESGERATADTSFYVASSTKSMVALVLATLHERGQIDLDAPISGFSSEAPFPNGLRIQNLTIRDLLAQRSGITNDPIVHRTAYSGEHTDAVLWRLLGATKRNRRNRLGEFQYSNHNYNIATLLVEREVGLGWKDLLQQELFGPAGMTRSSANISNANQAGWSLARAHTSLRGNGPLRTYLEKTDQTMHSAGGVIMSAGDAVKWLELMAEGGRINGAQLIPESVIQASRQPLSEVGASFEGFDRAHYGLGWYIGSYRGGDDELIHHFGGFAGARAHVSYVPQRRWGVAVFANGSQAGFKLADIIANYLYDRLEQRPDAKARLDLAIGELIEWNTNLNSQLAELDAQIAARANTLSNPLAAYVGMYRSRTYGTIEVSLEGDQLLVQNGNLRAIGQFGREDEALRVELVPLNADTVQFRLNRRDEVVSLEYKDAKFSKLEEGAD